MLQPRFHKQKLPLRQPQIARLELVRLSRVAQSAHAVIGLNSNPPVGLDKFELAGEGAPMPFLGLEDHDPVPIHWCIHALFGVSNLRASCGK